MTPTMRTLLLLSGGGAASVDADAQAWADAVTGAGGTYSAATLTAVSSFCVSAKANSYWTKLTRINVFAGNQLAAALVPLKVGGGNATDTNVNFVSGDYTEATGITGNGTTKYLNTGLLANALTANSTHLAVYNRSSLNAANNISIGANAATDVLKFFAPFSDGVAYSDMYNNAGGRVSNAVTTPFGMLVASRTASNAHAIYRNGVSLATNATSGGSLPARAIYVFAANNTGTTEGYISAALGAYSIGSGLTAGDVTAYNTDMQALMTAFGRNV
jgi:hypothetical protein